MEAFSPSDLKTILHSKRAKAGILAGFCGGGGTPLFSANETDFEVAWFSPQSEYRPTEYLQHWVRFWFDDQKRLQAAKHFRKGVSPNLH